MTCRIDRALLSVGRVPMKIPWQLTDRQGSYPDSRILLAKLGSRSDLPHGALIAVAPIDRQSSRAPGIVLERCDTVLSGGRSSQGEEVDTCAVVDSLALGRFEQAEHEGLLVFLFVRNLFRRGSACSERVACCLGGSLSIVSRIRMVRLRGCGPCLLWFAH